MTIAQFGKMAAKDTPGEGRSGHMIECIKNLIMQRGTCFPAPHRTCVSYLTILALILGYGAISFGEKKIISAPILPPLRDLGSALGTLFPWRPCIPPVSGFMPARTLCIALGLGQVLGSPSPGWVGAVCVVECVLRTLWHGVGLCPPNPLQRQRTCLSAATGHRCHFLKVDNPFMDQGGARIPWNDLAGWCVLVVWDAFVCGVCLCAFCGVVLPGCVVWAGVVGACISPRLTQQCITFNRWSSAPGSRRPRARGAAGRTWSAGPLALLRLDPFLCWVHWVVIVVTIGVLGTCLAVCRQVSRTACNTAGGLYKTPKGLFT